MAIIVTAAFIVAELVALPGWHQAQAMEPSSVVAVTDRPAIVTAPASHDRVVSAVPVSWTPQILDGRVLDTTQVGNSVVVAGQFTQVAPSSGSPVLNRTNVVAFNAVNGAINTAFAPNVSNGQVRAVEPGPTDDTVYLAGSFQGVNGVTKKIVLMNLTTGAIVGSFNAPAINGAVNDLQRVGSRLYVGGVFTVVGGQPFNGLVSLNALTGARESFLSVALTENQNYTGQPGQAQAPVGAKALAVAPQGDQMAVIGNFRKADGLDRRQMVLIDLTGATAAVRADWRTDRFAPACFSNAFDTYVRSVASSPDGSYFMVAATGGPNPGTLCDTVTRWNVANSGQTVQPDWLDDTGGDTLLSVASSGAAVYTGGHQRWMNNAGGRDYPAPGAVPRPGIGAVRVDNGVPLDWNPGRSPRGVGAESVFVSATGLWVGSDTEQIGHWKYRRPRIAFFPVSTGTPVGAGDTGALPSNVYKVPNAPSADAGSVLYRINAGGPTLPAIDGGPDWAADDGASSAFRNQGSNAAGWDPVASVDSAVPGSTPSQVFDSERWDPSDANEMAWSFPVPSGQEVVVRLYLSNRCSCTSAVGQRVFDVDIEGSKALENYDIVADVGDQAGTMKSFTVTSDGAIDLTWLHKIENPLVNGIEILTSIPAGEPTPESSGLSRVWFTGEAVDEPVAAAPAGDIDWSSVRGAVTIDGVLYYGTSDRELMRRTFDGETYGPATAVDPYNDPYWSDINTGSGQTFRGTKPSFYNDIPSLAGLAYDSGRLYYTKTGSNKLWSRGFAPDSGVITQEVRDVGALAVGGLGGIFFDEDAQHLYFVTTADGNLSVVPWVAGAASGAAAAVSGPAIDGVDWRGRALFLADGPQPTANKPPVAVLDADCERLECAFSAAGSSDEDGSIVSYLWDFGDGETQTGTSASYTYAESGSYTVKLTVTDNRGAKTTESTELVIVENEAPVAVITDPLVCDRLSCQFDGSGSSDADDSVASYEWDFGDGTTPSTEASPTHTFGEAGTYSVRLTVTDEFGATATASVEVAALANQPPVAVIGEPSCDALSCEFSGADSSDPDSGDAVTAYSWDFGDGSAAASGVTASHTFAAAGTYTVTLTVTDESGATGSTTHELEVVVSSGPVTTAAQFVGKSAVMRQQTASAAVSVPDGVQAGDLLVLFVTVNDATEGTGPAGAGEWTLKKRVVSGPLAVSTFTKVADGSEVGQSVTMTWPSSTFRTDLTMVAYRGVGEGGVEVLESATAANVSSHRTPAVTVQGEKRVALSFWADRSSSTTGWTAPAGIEVVSTQAGTGGGRVSSLLTAETVDGGTYGPLVATTDATSARDVTMTLLLAPTVTEGGGTPADLNNPPTASIAPPTCDLLSCALDGSASTDPDDGDSIAAYSWNLGDGSAAKAGATVSHTYAAAGTYTVTLTVTDQSGAEAETSRSVNVTDGSGPVTTAAQFVGKSAVMRQQTASAAVSVPDGVQAGDLLVLFVTVNDATEGTGPAGAGEWTLKKRVVSGPLAVSTFTKVADGSEVGQSVTMTWPSSTFRTDLTMVAYRGVGEGGVEVLESATAANVSSHRTPAVTVQGEKRVALSFWADRSSSTTGWTAPAGIEVVSTQAGTGGGRVSSLLTAETVDGGTYGPLVATTDATSARDVTMTLLLAPTAG
ncbi:PKD domain-containing protein [Microbacterium sp.]|uniref:PKD domain-containing protein n=1 Tax=Microbacterium sp. TaxID=51671 RepID=UPI0028A5ADB5|nr:PKD domain-containing protein [Microbacterium sp.]